MALVLYAIGGKNYFSCIIMRDHRGLYKPSQWPLKCAMEVKTTLGSYSPLPPLNLHQDDAQRVLLHAFPCQFVFSNALSFHMIFVNLNFDLEMLNF